MQAIAPFVTEGSYIEFFGEEGKIFSKVNWNEIAKSFVDGILT